MKNQKTMSGRGTKRAREAGAEKKAAKAAKGTEAPLVAAVRGFFEENGPKDAWERFFGEEGAWYALFTAREAIERDAGEWITKEWKELLDNRAGLTARWVADGMKLGWRSPVELAVMTLTFAEASFGKWEDLAYKRVEHYEEKEKDKLVERWEERGQYIAESDFGLAAACDPTAWSKSPEALMEFLEGLSDDYP